MVELPGATTSSSEEKVSNSHPVSDADQSVAELLSSLNIETSNDDLPPPPQLDDLIIQQDLSSLPPAPEKEEMKATPPVVFPKPYKKPSPSTNTSVSTVTIQLGKPKGDAISAKPQPVTIVAPVTLDQPPPKPTVTKPAPVVAPKPAPVVTPKPAPVVAPKPAPIVAPEPAPVAVPKLAPVIESKPAPVVAPKPAPAPAPEPTAVKPFPTLAGAMSADDEKTLTDLENDLDFYTKTLLSNVENPKDEEFYGYCAKCNGVVEGEQVGCKAFGKIFHIKCFCCETCGKNVHGIQFYAINEKPYCEQCYLDSLEKCVVCGEVITDKILRASGKAYHPRCFVCCVCTKSLDGVPFTVDDESNIFCVDCYYQKYAVKCSACGEAILPEEGKEETVRIVALDRDFHVACYKCVKCSVQLSSSKDGQGCYPLDGQIMCLNCNTMAVAN